MGVFDPRPSFRGVTGTERMASAMDMPFSFGQAFGENFSQGITDSFGLGTAIRELSTPSLLSDRPFRGETPENYEARRGRFETQSLSEDEYKTSPFFREAVPYQPGMTPDRAAALAKSADTRAVRQYFSQKQPIAAFLGQFGGQALDPINYVPVFGQGAQLAAVARFGSIGGRALMSASEAAINTAAFGILTAGVRSRLGDDVSFEMIGTEIAMSALIGGAFGGGIGMLVRGRDARERVALGQARNALSTAANRQKAAIALNEQIDALATTGNPAATPNGMASIETVHTEVQRRVTAARSLDEQTAGVTGTKAGEVVIAPSGRRVSVVPEVVELDSLIHAEGALQVRNRRTAASDAQIEEIGATLDPARMMPNIDGSQGAPLVGADHIIDSGNGRVAGVRRAYEAYPEKAEAYRAFLAEQGYNVEGMQRPVLINRRVTNLDETARAQFNAELNGRTTASLGAVEIAQMDRAAMTDNVLDAHAPAPVTAASNRAFVQRFMAQLPANDRQALLSADGKALSAEGVRRIENALFASAYGDIDPSAVRRFAEGVDDNTRSIVGAMSDMAGAWAKMRRDAKAGVIPQHLDQTQELTDALRLIGMWREQAVREGRPVAKVISEGMAQMDLLTGEISPETQVFVRSFYTSDAFTRAQGREALASQFADLIESGYELGRPSLFGDAMPEVSALQVLENAVRRNAETDARPVVDALSRAEENGAAELGLAAGADRGLDRQSAEAGAEALAEADIFSHGADLGERPMSSADIADAMRERFENAGRPADEAEAAAGMLSTFYSTMAARTGRSINDLLKIAPLPEVRRGGQPDMSAQALAQSQPGNPAFDRWFGDSKVVDAEGKPLVVYHHGGFDENTDTPQGGMHFGTDQAARERAFGKRVDEAAMAVTAHQYEDGTWYWDDGQGLTSGELDLPGYSSEDSAILYGRSKVIADMNNGGMNDVDAADLGNTTAVYLTIKKPKRVADQGGANGEWDAAIAQAKAEGHDGIVYRNQFEDKGSDSYIAFDPTQIKSVNNRGTFDPNDPRILFQGPGEPVPPDLYVVHNIKPGGVLNADKMGGLAMPSLAVTRLGSGDFSSYGSISLIGSPDLIDPKAAKEAKTFNADAYSPRYPSVQYDVDTKAFSDLNKRVVEKAREIGGDEHRGALDPNRIEDRGIEDAIDSQGLMRLYLAEKGKVPEVVMREDGKGPDFYGNDDAMKKAIQPQRAEYEEWARGLLSPLVKRERIFKGFDNNGNRRYREHNMENVLADMRSRLREGEGLNYGIGTIRSKHAKQFKSIEAMQKARDKIVPHKGDDIKGTKDEFGDRFFALADEMRPYYKFEANSFQYPDDTAMMFGEVGQKGMRALDEGFKDLPPELRQKVQEFLADLADAPTEYFETKMQRAVGLGEFQAALVPSDTTPNVRKALEKAGLQVIEYDPKVEGSRVEAVKALNAQRAEADPRILFQPAWHGTPHIFDKFEWSDKTRGKGEGAQAFGDGLYFAGKKQVAEHYRNVLSGGQVAMPSGARLRLNTLGEMEEFGEKLIAEIETLGLADERFPDGTARALLSTRPSSLIVDAFNSVDTNAQGDSIIAAARNWLAEKQQTEPDRLESTYVPAADARAAGKAYGTAIKLLDELEAKGLKVESGRLYKVDIPGDDELMLWDAPMSEQPAGVIEKLLPFAEQLSEGRADVKAIWEKRIRGEKVMGFGQMTGDEFYRLLSRARIKQEPDQPPGWGQISAGGDSDFRGDAAASAALREAGIPGHRFLDGGSRGSGEGSYNYVIYDDSRVSITEFEQGARGSIEFGSDGRSVMSMFDAADASTALHESAHWFLQMFRSFADRADAPAEIRADWDRVRAWWTENADAVAADSPTGATGDDVRRLMETGTSGNRLVDIGIEVGMQEQWARGFEAYLREGVAPNEGLRGIFDQFKRWLTSIYRQALDLNVNINDDIRGVFDRLLAQQQGDLVPNSTAPKPDPVPDGLDAAAAAVRTPADPLKLGAQYGLDDAGGFAEQADIDALKASDMLTPEDQAMLDEADQLVADAEAYGKTLETAAWCMR